MIKLFCDCCGEEIKNTDIKDNALVLPFKEVSIVPNGLAKLCNCAEDYCVKLTVLAKIIKYDDLNGRIPDFCTDSESGHIICKDCVIKVLTDK